MVNLFTIDPKTKATGSLQLVVFTLFYLLLIHFAHVGLFDNFGDVKDRGLSEELSRVPCPVQERRGLSGLYYQVTLAQRIPMRKVRRRRILC